MAYGFKCYTSAGEVICDGTSLMHREFYYIEQSVVANTTYIINFPARPRMPLVSMFFSTIPVIIKCTYIFDGTNYTGISLNVDVNCSVKIVFLEQ